MSENQGAPGGPFGAQLDPGSFVGFGPTGPMSMGLPPPTAPDFSSALKAQHAWWSHYAEFLQHALEDGDSPARHGWKLWMDWGLQWSKFADESLKSFARFQLECAKAYIAFLEQMSDSTLSPLQPPGDQHDKSTPP